MPRQILVIAAHPDDETYGLGGAIARHVRRGGLVSVLNLADGVTARHNLTESQKAAARQAYAVLGADDVCFSGLPDECLDAMPLLEAT